MALYGLKSSGAAFRSKLLVVLRDIGYLSTKGDPNLWIRPVVKPYGTEYHKMVLCYVDDILAISATPMKNIEGIKAVFKLKGDKSEVTDMYLGDDIQNAYLVELCREKIWTFSGPEFGEKEGTLMLRKNGIIWDKVTRSSIPIQAIRITEGYWLNFHKRGPRCMDSTGSKTIWHRIPQNDIMLC